MSGTRAGSSSLKLLARNEGLARLSTCEYLAEMSEQLSEIAFKNGLDSLAIIFEKARQDAERILQASDEHLNRS